MRQHRAGGPAPPDAEAVLAAMDRLFQRGRLDLFDLAVLRDWGARQRRPPSHPAWFWDALAWAEAMALLDAELRREGIVG